MRKLIDTIKYGGPAAVVTVVAGGWVLRDEIHYLLRPSVMETIGAVAVAGGGALWAKGASKRRAERKAEQSVDARIARLAEQLEQRNAQALPHGQRVEYGGHRDYTVPRVIHSLDD